MSSEFEIDWLRFEPFSHYLFQLGLLNLGIGSFLYFHSRAYLKRIFWVTDGRLNTVLFVSCSEMLQFWVRMSYGIPIFVIFIIAFKFKPTHKKETASAASANALNVSFLSSVRS